MEKFYKAPNTDEYYANANAAYQEALRIAQENAKAQADISAERTTAAADSARTQAFTNAQRTAQGSNEILASYGLSGNLYTAPRSGYTESSRINENVAMRNALNAVTRQEEQGLQDIDLQLSQQAAAGQSAYQQYLANAEMQRAQDAIGQSQYEGTLGYNYWAAQQDQANADRNYSMNLALNELSSFGKIMTDQAASTLGMPVGTSTLEYEAYQNSLKNRGSGGNSVIQSGGPTIDPEAQRVDQMNIADLASRIQSFKSKIPLAQYGNQKGTAWDPQSAEYKEYTQLLNQYKSWVDEYNRDYGTNMSSVL